MRARVYNKDWFCINFDGNSAYNDGFWYEGWEGHYELVKLNLYNPAVVDYLLLESFILMLLGEENPPGSAQK